MKYGLSSEELDTIRAHLARQPGIRQAVLFGSRVLGTFKEASDIDIALKGEGLDLFTCGSLKSRLEDETNIPYFFDFVAYDTLTNEALRQHIDTHGVCIYGEGEGGSGWRELKLSDFVELGRDQFKPNQAADLNYIGLEHIEQEKLRLNSVGHSSEIASNKFFFKVGDVLFGKLRPYFRKVVKARFDGVCSTDIWVVRAKGNFSQDFVFYFMANWEFIDTANAGEGGSRMPRADWNFLKNTEWSIPEYAEQKAIAAVLSSLDDKIDLLHRQNKTLESMAATLFRQWFVEEAQEDWNDGVISDLVEFNPPRKLAKGTIAPYLEMASLSTTTFNPEGWYDREFSSGTKFINGDTLLARITPCLENGKTAYVTILNNDQVGWGSTEYIVMQPKGDLHPFFAYVLARNSDFRDFAEGCLAGSSGRQRVETNHLMSYKIKMPAEDIVKKFNAVAESIAPKLHSNAVQIRTLEKLRDTLLPKLMSGEVRVAA